MSEVRVAGVGMTRFAKHHDRTIKDMVREAVGNAVQDANLEPSDVELAVFGNAAAGLITGQEMIRGQVALREAGIGGIPIINVDNACAGGSTALHVAWMAVTSGQVDVAIAVGAEKLSHPDKSVSLNAFTAAVDVERATQIAREVSDLPEDSLISPKRSLFMDIYAARIRRYMERTGTTVEHLARVTVKSHRFGSLNPYAQFRSPVTIEEVLNAPTISQPLTRMMCSPIGDGAAAAIVISGRRLAPFANRPRIAASVLRSGNLPDSKQPTAEERAIASAYEMAGVGPDGLDVVEVHDATSPAELLAYERLGICEPGGASGILDQGVTDLGGRTPVNTSGGLVARGHPIGATGLGQVCELVWQLRGMCGPRQVQGARVGLAQNGGGFLGNDAAAEAVHILVR